MPSPAYVEIASSINDLVEANACKIGRQNLFKFRYRFTPTTVVPILGLYVPDPNCYVVVELLRASCSDVNFQYGAVHEYIIYNYTNGVGSFASTNPVYAFNGGAGMIYTRTDSFIPASGSTPPFLGINFSQPGPVTAFLAGYGSYTIIPNRLDPGLPYPKRPVSQIGSVADAFSRESLASPYNLFPYRRYNDHVHVPLPATVYRITPNIGLDPANVNNSSLLIKLSIQGSQITNHGNNVSAIYYYTLQGGSETVPPYTMIMRNSTTITSFPNVFANSMGVVVTPTVVTGSVSTVPSVYFSITASNVPAECEVFAKAEVVCAAHDPANYS